MNTATKFAVAAAVAGVGWYLWKRHTAAPAAPVHGLGFDGGGPAGFVRIHQHPKLDLVSMRPLNGRGAAGGVSGMGSFWDDLTDMARLSIIAPLSLVDTHLRPKVAADIRSLPGGGHLPLLPGTHVTPVSPPVAAIPDTTTDGTPSGIVWDGIPGDPGDPSLIAQQSAAIASAGQGAPGSAYVPPPPSGKFNPLVAGAAAVVAIPVLFLVGKK
jgi:hypothetical protein